MQFTEDEKQNILGPISENTLKEKQKFNTSAAEMFNFVQNLIFLIGDLVPEDDAILNFVQVTIRYFYFYFYKRSVFKA